MSLLRKLSSRLGISRAQSCPTPAVAPLSPEEVAAPEKIFVRSLSAGAAPVNVKVNRPQIGPIASREKAVAAMAYEERTKSIASQPSLSAGSLSAAESSPSGAETPAQEMSGDGRLGMPRGQPAGGAKPPGDALALRERLLKFFTGIRTDARGPVRTRTPPPAPPRKWQATVAMQEEDYKRLESGPPLAPPAITRPPEEYVPAFGGSNPPWMRVRLAEAAVAVRC